MNEVLPTGRRDSLLRSKRIELTELVKSRKRKLCELYSVTTSELPIPQLSKVVDAPATNTAESHFLDDSDILKDRLFDEINLPPRRSTRSSTSKQRSPIRKPSPEARQNDASRRLGKVQRDGAKPRNGRGTPPRAKDDGESTMDDENGVDTIEVKESTRHRSSSKGSQTELPEESATILNAIVEESLEHAALPSPSLPDDQLSSRSLERDKIPTRLGSRANSPGVDPRKAMPISAEDAAQLSEPLIQGLGSHDVPHKAVTAHLPAKEVQERHLRQSENQREHREGLGGHLSINPPARDHGRNLETLSSPGSTIEAHSATTPAMYEASTDTSPENEPSRYDPDRIQTGDGEPRTPPRLRPSSAEEAEKLEHDKILKAQIEIARAEILRSSPSAADNQLLMEERAATTLPESSREIEDSQGENETDREEHDALTKEANIVVRDTAEDEDEVIGVPTPDDHNGFQDSTSQVPSEKPPEVADSEDDGQTPMAESMDVDVAPVNASSSSNAELGTQAMPATAVEEVVETPMTEKDVSAKASATDPDSARCLPPSTSPCAPPAMERMTTRVASGAMRHKSVSEILGETPKPGTSSAPKGDQPLSASYNSVSRSLSPQSSTTRVRSLAEKAREKERSKLSTVVFPSRPSKPATDRSLIPSGSRQAQALKEDYFLPLFLATASTDKRGVPSLDNLLATAHKTITTSNAYVPINENQTNKILKRIYNLQSSNKWSLRQPKRSAEPIRPTAHWDVLLQEAKWMRTDFREERKWKTTVARNMVYACAEWVTSSPDDRKLLQVKARAPVPVPVPVGDLEMTDVSSQPLTHPTPDLVASGENDSPMDEIDEEPRLDLRETVAPTAIFGLLDDDVVFGLRRSPTTDKLLDELPMYGAPLKVPQSGLPTSEIDPDRFWRRPALPLSKYVEGRMELKIDPQPRKRSRFEYEEEDGDDEQQHVVFGEKGTKRVVLPPETTEVALFTPEHRHIRERIHSAHQFRPPSEFPMPLQSFFENRVASQWIWDEDNELKRLVRDFSYNWSLISSMLTSRSMLSSGAERRTPWECFERWIHLEGLPADMQKTHYFRAYTTRIEAANRNVMAQPVPQPANGGTQIPSRRRSTSSVRVERRRSQKYIHLVDAMRKLAKKRETTMQKQQHAAGMAAMRKANEAPHVATRSLPATTPQDFSRMKHERDEVIKERLIHLQQRQEQQRRAAMQQARVAPNGQPLVHQNGVTPRPPASTAMAPNNSTPSNQNLAVPGQNRPRPMPPQMAGQPMPNGHRVPQMGMNGVGQAPMQGQLPLPNPALDVGLVTRAHQISQHQQAILRQQQGQLPGQSPNMHNSPPRLNGMPAPGFPMQGNMMPPFNTNMNGVSTPPNPHIPPGGQGQAGSPRMGQLPQSMTGTSHIQMLEQQLKARNPSLTQEQITSLITKQLSQSMQQQNRQSMAQNAMNAAAGPGGGNAMSMNGMSAGQGTPQLYAQMLRQQQEAQQKQQQAQQQAANAGSTALPLQSNGGNAGPGHAHRASSGSVQSGK